MDNLEKLLENEKRQLHQIEVPMELEDKLRGALENTSKKYVRSFQKRIAMIILFFLIISTNFDILAYYTGKFVGYEPVMTGSIQKLNEMGKGQRIEKSYTFSDGVSVSLDGVMLDDNGMNFFYTIKAPSEKIEEASSRMDIQFVTGFERGFSSSGMGELDEENNEQKWILQTRGAPKLFDNKMKLRANYTTQEGKVEIGEIPFRLDRRKAIGKSLRIPIHKEIAIDDNRNIKIKSLTASPTTTVIKGQIQNIFELGLDQITNNRLYPENIEMELYANGQKVPLQGSGMSTNLEGSHYELIFDALPEDTREIEVKFVSFQGKRRVNESRVQFTREINEIIFTQKLK